MSAATDTFENMLIDLFFRGQSQTINSKTLSWSAGPSLYVGLHTATPSDSSVGTEVTGGSYARVAVACTTGNWAGTQGAGTTAASSGTTGTTSNNVAITFPTPSAGWGTVTHFGIFDAASSGNMLYWGTLTVSKAINSGDQAPVFNAGALTVQVDN